MVLPKMEFRTQDCGPLFLGSLIHPEDPFSQDPQRLWSSVSEAGGEGLEVTWVCCQKGTLSSAQCFFQCVP